MSIDDIKNLLCVGVSKTTAGLGSQTMEFINRSRNLLCKLVNRKQV